MAQILIALVHEVKTPDFGPQRISWETRQASPDTVRFDLCFSWVCPTMGWVLGRVEREGMGKP
jgi:hypothetical protein